MSRTTSIGITVLCLWSFGLMAQESVPRPKPCLIITPYKKTASDALTRWTVPKPFNYVEGDFPGTMRFRSELNDKDIRQIKALGGHVVIVRSGYELPDLEDARKSCDAFQASK